MSDAVRWGILGSGRAARNIALAIQATGGAFVAMASRAGKPDYETLAARDDVDVLHVATPHTAHYANALLGLEAGKHVLCEKPMVLRRREAEHLAEVARQRGRFLMEAVWTRFLPASERLRALVRGGSLGEPRTVHASFALRFEPERDRRVFDPALGGGALNELGTYPLAFAVEFLGPPLSCDAAATFAHEVNTQCAFHCIHAAGISRGFCALDFEGRNHVTVAATEGQATLLPAAGRFETLSLWKRADRREMVEDHGYEGSGYEFMIEHVQACLRDGLRESAVMPLADSIALADALERCNRAIAA